MDERIDIPTHSIPHPEWGYTSFCYERGATTSKPHMLSALQVQIASGATGLIWCNGAAHAIENMRVYCHPPMTICAKQWGGTRRPAKMWIWQVAIPLVAAAARVSEEDAREFMAQIPFLNGADALEFTTLMATLSNHFPRPENCGISDVNDPVARLHDMGVICELLQLLMKDIRYSEEREGNNVRVSRMMPVVERCASEGLSVAETAHILSVTPEHLSRLFKHTTGKSIGECLAMIRVANARQLLANTNLSIGRISLDTGFSSPTHFSRVFSKYEGVTPKRWQLANRIGKLRNS